MSSMMVGPASVMLVESGRGSMSAEAFKSRLDMVLAVVNNGAIGSGGHYYGSEEHLKALDAVDAQVRQTRALIAEQAIRDAAISFDELVQRGRESGCTIVNGMPWAFEYAGWHVTHENDECYLICSGAETLRMTPDHVLLSYADGRLAVELLDG